jgi:dipeptidyl aminopeptidase/acylaminoacyl peptidase
MRRTLTLLLFLALTTAVPLAAQITKSDEAFLDEMHGLNTIQQVAISPDGRRVAWSERDGDLVLGNTDGSAQVRLHDAGAEGLAFSPDSRTLVWVADAGKGQKQLYLREGIAPPRQLTNVKGYLAEPRWSPDGKSIAFLFIENARRAAGPLVAMSRAVGVIEEHIEEQRVAVIDVRTRAMRVVTPADSYVYHFDWSPDSMRLAAIAAPGSGDNNYWIATLNVVDVGAMSMKSVYKPELQIANPRWSPDGTRIAFIEGLMSDEGATGGDLFVVDAGGGNPRNLTPAVHASVTTLEWTAPDSITFGENVAGDAAIARLRTSDGAIETIWRGAESVSAAGLIGASLSRDGGSSAIIRSSWQQPPAVWAGKTGAWTKISPTTATVKPTWGAVTSTKWKSDQFDVQGWLMAPAQIDPARKAPVVVWVHGGPASATIGGWPNERAALLSRKGFYVFFPNPRGSYGQGEAFTRANVKDFGYGDLRDILAGLDAVGKEAPVDTSRAGIWGWSYGGFMTMFAVTQTQRFKAAVAGAGIANWQSYYGENDIDRWMIPYFGASVYDDPAVYARSAPITFIKNVKTPTLVLVGERDGECPAPQSFEFWHALKSLGVETQMVVYPDEGHRIAKPEHRRDISRRLVGWFAQHL